MPKSAQVAGAMDRRCSKQASIDPDHCSVEGNDHHRKQNLSNPEKHAGSIVKKRIRMIDNPEGEHCLIYYPIVPKKDKPGKTTDDHVDPIWNGDQDQDQGADPSGGHRQDVRNGISEDKRCNRDQCQNLRCI